ncbi:MAG: lytic transglycosylase [Fibrobacteres bacterium]|nr:lytic transglycosylase [Fibrobacterota bacterium]
MMMKVNSRVAAALMAGFTALAPLAWTGPLEANRKLIITDASFTADKYILDQACIMIELYYRMDEDEGLLFDPEAPEVIFGKVPLRNLNAKMAEDSLSKAKEALKAELRAMSGLPESEWTEGQKAMRRFFPPNWNPDDMAGSTERMAGRRGMRRSFRNSLEASLPYLDLMDSVFKAEGVPSRLMYLAHVESRFNPEAVSPAGAAGMWQFLKSSGARYLVIDERVDQRFDPRASTFAAARFLKLCRKYMSSWPLAIMAYNNGPGQMLDAVKSTGSRDPSEIIQNYQAGGFGGVSRNYYAMFLAASSLGMKADQLFPGLRKIKPTGPAFKTLKLEHEWTPRQLRILSGYSTAVIMKYNPALRPVVFERNLPVPKGFELQLPVGLPTIQDLQFADLRIAGETAESRNPTHSAAMAGFPMPRFAESALLRVRKALFSHGRKDDQPMMAYMHSQGLLDTDRLASAKQEGLLIEPHPALHAMIRGMGG